MNQNYFENWSEVAKKVQEPIQAITELNMKTFQSLNYLKPEELTKLNKPEEVFEKQFNLAVENGRKALDYMQKSFQIYEKFMFSMLQEAKNKTEAAIKK